jgi:predicted small lipoprotein YifL
MGIEQKILVRGSSLRACMASTLCVLLTLTACGQKGNLYMPNDPEFKQRATLPDIVRRQLPGNTQAPATGAASAPTSGTTTPPATQPTTTSPATAASAAAGR